MRDDAMSYTMTMDMPPKVSEYVCRQGNCFLDELKALVLAFVTVRMQRDMAVTSLTGGVSVHAEAEATRRYDLSGFFGKAKMDGDAVAFQRNMRDEW